MGAVQMLDIPKVSKYLLLAKLLKFIEKSPLEEYKDISSNELSMSSLWNLSLSFFGIQQGQLR